jgi:hypothetical protein
MLDGQEKGYPLPVLPKRSRRPVTRAVKHGVLAVVAETVAPSPTRSRAPRRSRSPSPSTGLLCPTRPRQVRDGREATFLHGLRPLEAENPVLFAAGNRPA